MASDSASWSRREASASALLPEPYGVRARRARAAARDQRGPTTERQALTAKVQRDAAAIAGIAQAPGAGSSRPGPCAAPGRDALPGRDRRSAWSSPDAAVVRSSRLGPALAAGNRAGAVPGDADRVRGQGAGRRAHQLSDLAHQRPHPSLLAAARRHAPSWSLRRPWPSASSSRWVARPLLALGEAARRVGHGDLGARAPVGSGPVEVEAVAAAFNTTTAHLQRMVTAQREFVADASHQLRSPLTALRLRLENLEPVLASGGRAGLEGALAEVGRLSAMVDGLLVLGPGGACAGGARCAGCRGARSHAAGGLGADRGESAEWCCVMRAVKPA